jgi:hypothetical protein
MLPISANLLFASRLAGEGLLFFPGAGMGAFFKTRLNKKNDPVRFSGRAVFFA